MLQSLNLAPGLYSEDSELAASGAYIDGDNVRFWKGRPQKVGGSQELATSKLIGAARGNASWAALDGTRYAAFGTACGLFLLQGSVLHDITPIASQINLVNAMSTTAGSTTVIIRHENHGLVSTQRVVVGTVVVGGITVEGDYTATVIDNDFYSIEHSTPALTTEAPTYGWGTRTYGSGPYGGGN